MSNFLSSKPESFFPGKPTKIGAFDFDHRGVVDENLAQRIVAFLQKDTYEYWAGVVVGLSEGLDGASTAALALRSFDRADVLGVIVQCGDTPESREQRTLAVRTAEALEMEYTIIDATQIREELVAAARSAGPFSEVNATTRAIEDVIFQVADGKNYAVLSSINKSEILTGRLPEYFYGHLAPLADLYKSEIFDLAHVLNIPEEVIERKPGGIDTWYDEDTFGVTYDILDKVLYLLVEKEMSPKEISQRYDVDLVWLEKLQLRTYHRFWRLTTRAFSR